MKLNANYKPITVHVKFCRHKSGSHKILIISYTGDILSSTLRVDVTFTELTVLGWHLPHTETSPVIHEGFLGARRGPCTLPINQRLPTDYIIADYNSEPFSQT